MTAAWLASRRSVHTRRAYTADVDGWLRWCTGLGLDPLMVRRRHVQVWGAQLHTDGAAPSTTARKLATVSGWYRALAAEDLVAVVPTLEVERAPVDADDSAVLGLDQVAAVALLRSAAADNPRSHALIALLLVRALRVAEALDLDVTDVTDTVRGHRVARVFGKGGRRRLAALPPAVSRAVDVLVGGRIEGSLFVTRTGARWVASEAYRTVRRRRSTAP